MKSFAVCPAFRIPGRLGASAEKSKFDDRYPKDSPIDALLCAINNGMSGENKKYAHSILLLDSSLWLPTSRERMFLILAHRDLPGGLAKAECVVDEVLHLYNKHSTMIFEDFAERGDAHHHVDRSNPSGKRVADLLYPASAPILAQCLAQKEAQLLLGYWLLGQLGLGMANDSKSKNAL